MRIAVVGHAFAPDRGSEEGFTWNWAWHLSEHEEVWVFAHPENRVFVEQRLQETSRPRLHVHWVNLPAWCDPYDPTLSERWVRLHYTIWQWVVLAAVRRLHLEFRFDVVHHVSLGTINVPPLLWKLGIPFVWGPIGGGQKMPWRFLRYSGDSWFREFLRNLHVTTLSLRQNVRRAATRSSLVLATNMETANALQKAGARHLAMLVDGGIHPELIPPTAPLRKEKSPITFLWAGRLEPRKGLLLALEAFATLTPDVPAQLLVAGQGPERQRCAAAAKRLGIEDRVRFLGWVRWQDMPKLFQDSDVFLFTSIQDSFGSVLLEAMAQGLPIIALNHQGPGAIVPQEAGIKVPVTTPAAVRSGIALAIQQLTLSHTLRRQMSIAAWEFASTQAWDRRALSMLDTYHQLTTAAVTPSVPCKGSSPYVA